MIRQTYEKLLTANDTGETGGHQAGIHIPKLQADLLALLPFLDPGQKNPDAWLDMTDGAGCIWRFRFVYYNNQLHDQGGTRDEYRITHMTRFLRAMGATAGDVLVLSGAPGRRTYSIAVRKAGQRQEVDSGAGPRVRLRGWRRVH